MTLPSIWQSGANFQLEMAEWYQQNGFSSAPRMWCRGGVGELLWCPHIPQATCAGPPSRRVGKDEVGIRLVWLSSHLSLSPGGQTPPLPFQAWSFFLLLQRGGNETVPVGRSLSRAPSPTQLGDSSVPTSRIRTWMLSEASFERLRASLPWLKKEVTPAWERLLGDSLPVYLPTASSQR